MALCRLLVAVLRREEGAALVTACNALAVMALQKGRPTLLHRFGALPALVDAISDSRAEHAQLAAAALALQVMLADEFVCSHVDFATLHAIMGRVEARPVGEVHRTLTQALLSIAAHNTVCQEELARHAWLHEALVVLLQHEGGSHPTCAAAGALLARICYDAEVAARLGAVPGLVAALARMLASGENHLRDPALDALLALAAADAHLPAIGRAPGVVPTLLDTLRQQSLKLFPVAAALLCRLLPDPRVCNAVAQARGVLKVLLDTLGMRQLSMVTAALDVLAGVSRSVAASFEAAQSARALSDEDAAVHATAAGQAAQLGANAHAMRALCAALRRPEPGVGARALAALQATLQASPAACAWAVENPAELAAIADGLGALDQEICRLSVLAVLAVASEPGGAKAVAALGAFTKVKVLLYSECADAVKAAAVHALKPLLLGVGRVAAPDDELVLTMTAMMFHKDARVQEAAAEILARMIQQDYIELYATVHAARNLPQSDNWGLCDAFCVLSINAQSARTPVVRNNLAPTFDFQCHLSISDKSEDLVVELYDWDNAGDELLGTLASPPPPPPPSRTKWTRLVPPSILIGHVSSL